MQFLLSNIFYFSELWTECCSKWGYVEEPSYSLKHFWTTGSLVTWFIFSLGNLNEYRRSRYWLHLLAEILHCFHSHLIFSLLLKDLLRSRCCIIHPISRDILLLCYLETGFFFFSMRPTTVVCMEFKPFNALLKLYSLVNVTGRLVQISITFNHMQSLCFI